MKSYRGIVKGNTVLLEQELDVPEGTEAIVLIPATDADEEQEITRRQIELLKHPHKGGKLLYHRREELYDRR